MKTRAFLILIIFSMLFIPREVIEHFHYPEKLISEMCLKPGGLAIIMSFMGIQLQIYFEDYSHRTPFMLSLEDIQLIHGFNMFKQNSSINCLLGVDISLSLKSLHILRATLLPPILKSCMD